MTVDSVGGEGEVTESLFIEAKLDPFTAHSLTYLSGIVEKKGIFSILYWKNNITIENLNNNIYYLRKYNCLTRCINQYLHQLAFL